MNNRVILVMGHIGVEPSLVLKHTILHVELSHFEYGIGAIFAHEPEGDVLSMEELFSNLQVIAEASGLRGSTRSDLAEFAKGQRGLSETLHVRKEMLTINSLDEELCDVQFFFEHLKNSELYKHYKWNNRLRKCNKNRKRSFQRKTFPKQIV